MERRPIPLKVVPDEIAAPAGTTTISLNSGTTYLPNGNTFQIASGTITVTFDDSSVTVISSTRVQELTDRLDELIRKYRATLDSLSNTIRMGVLGPAVPAQDGDGDGRDRATSRG